MIRIANTAWNVSLERYPNNFVDLFVIVAIIVFIQCPNFYIQCMTIACIIFRDT